MTRSKANEALPYWLALNRCVGTNPRLATKLLKHFGGPRAILEAGSSGYALAGVSAKARDRLSRLDWPGVELDLDWASSPDHHIVVFGQAGYPTRLAEIPDPPAVLFVAGDVNALASPQVAIVGSRASTGLGRSVARRLGQDLISFGLTVTSGLARGIDGAAQRAACEAGGPCVGVAAHGLDRIYPRSNRYLFDTVRACGALVSEFAIGTAPCGHHFPQRNRVVSGLSLGVVVVEAASRSGSLITARLAAEQGREVFAVPGPVAEGAARGCHRLLREGATLVEDAADVIDGLPGWATADLCGVSPATEVVDEVRLDPESMRVLEALEFVPLAAEEVAERARLTIERVSSILLALELQGLASFEAGSRYARAPEAQRERNRLGRVDVPVRPLSGR